MGVETRRRPLAWPVTGPSVNQSVDSAWLLKHPTSTVQAMEVSVE